MLSSREMEAIEFALSHGTLHDAYQIDKKACLLAMYDTISFLHPYVTFPASQDVIIVSPMRRAGAPLTFDQCSHHFEWTRWDVCDKDGPSIQMVPSIAIGNQFWTRYVEGAIIEDVF